MKKQLFREHFQEYAHSELKCSFDSLNAKQRSIWMARFYADKLLRAIFPSLIPETEDDMHECVIDGPNDCGVDFFSRQGNTVLVIQAKYSSIKKRGKKAIEEPETFEYFGNVLERLYAGPKRFKMNRKLREAITEIDWEKDSLILHYITLSQPAGNSWVIAERGVSSLPDVPDLPDRTTLELLDEEKLNIALRDAMNQAHGRVEPIRVLFSENQDQEPWLCFEDADSGRQSYVGRINGAQVATLFNRYKSRLFALNIRNYIGDTSTNREMRKSAKETPRDFFYKNNGICAVATRISPVEGDGQHSLLECDSFSIVNGAQTVRSLAKAHGDDPKSLHNVEVLLRIVEYKSKLTQSEQTFLDNVIRYNNTQNAIKVSDFRSNDRVQYSLRKHFSAVPARNGKKFLYKNKRTGEKNSNCIGITMEEFVKTIHAFQFGPDDVYGGSSYLFDTGKEGGYRKLFSDESVELTSERFRELAGIWFLCEFVRGLWKESRKQSQAEALERRWMVYYAIGVSLRIAYVGQRCDVASDLRSLADPHWQVGAESRCERIRAVINAHTEAAIQALRKSYEAASKADDFRHRNWFRDSSTLERIHSELESFAIFTSKMPEQYIIKNAG